MTSTTQHRCVARLYENGPQCKNRVTKRIELGVEIGSKQLVFDKVYVCEDHVELVSSTLSGLAGPTVKIGGMKA